MRRRTLVTSAAAAVAATAGGGWWLARRPVGSPVAAGVPVATAAVVRTDLATTNQVPGALGYRGEYTIYFQGSGGTMLQGASGTVTALPEPGQVINRGEPVFAVDNHPVRLFFGDLPAWRPLAAGVTAGPDVRALEDNLKALGHLAQADDRFTATTTAAIRRWQRATGQTVTGRVELGAVTFQPGPLRITTVTAKVGGPARGEEPLLSATSTTAVVTINVPAARTYLVHPGDAVTVTMPDGKAVPGKVAFLSPVAQAPESDNGRPVTPTVPGLVTLDNPDTAGGLDRAPVQVNVTGRSVKGVLAVPITALVALAGGGYGVYVRAGTDRRLVGVTTGLFATTLVEVTGDDVHEGDLVEVPAG